MKSVLKRAVAGGAVAATATAVALALVPTAQAASNPPYEPDPQSVGTITLYDSAGHQVTSGKLSDRPIAAYAVGSASPRTGDASAALFAAQPNPSASTSDWNSDQLSGFTAFPVKSGPGNITGLGASRPVVTGTSSDLSLQSFVSAYPSPPAGSNNSTDANVYQLRLRTANSAGNQSTTYDVMDVKVDKVAGTWTELYPANSVSTVAVIEENNAALRTTWQRVSAKQAYAGGFLREHQSGAAATWSFTGTSVTIYLVSGKDQGLADVYVDGSKKTTVNGYAKATKFRVAHTIGKLRKSNHTIRVVVLGKRGNKAATGTFVSIDRVVSGKQHTETPSTTTWRTIANKGFYAGHARTADLGGESVTLSFRGTAITWYTMRAANQGQAVVYLDGKKKVTVDNYAKKTSYKVKYAFTKLANGQHTLRIVVAGKQHKGATGAFVTIDRFLTQ